MAEILYFGGDKIYWFGALDHIPCLFLFAVRFEEARWPKNKFFWGCLPANLVNIDFCGLGMIARAT